MTVWIVVIVMVALIAVALVVLEVGNRRRSRALAHLDAGDPAAGAHAIADAEQRHAATEAQARAGHQGVTGAGGMGPGA